MLRYNDAAQQTTRVLDRLEKDGFIQTVPAADRSEFVNAAAQKALERFDETMRALAQRLYSETQRDLGPQLVRYAIDQLIGRMREAGDLKWPAGTDEEAEIENLTKKLTPKYATWLANAPSPEDITQLSQDVAKDLADAGAIIGRSGELGTEAVSRGWICQRPHGILWRCEKDPGRRTIRLRVD